MSSRLNPLRGLVLATYLVLGLIGANAHAGTWHVIETFTDGCDEDVTIKKPYTGPEGPSLDYGDVLLCRSNACKNLIVGNPPAFQGVAANGSGVSPFTTRAWLHPVPKNGDRYFRWFCGLTAERSRCPTGTDALTVRLKSPGAFETKCWDFDP